MLADKDYGNGYGALKQGSYRVWNIHFQYNLQLGPVANKPTNKRYYANQYSRRSNSGNLYGKPRNAVFNLKWKMQPPDKIRPSEKPVFAAFRRPSGFDKTETVDFSATVV